MKMNEGHLGFDGSTVTLEFSGMLTQAAKKKASPRLIPVSDILEVEVHDGGRMTPGYVRFHRASTPNGGEFKAGFDPDTITFLAAKRPPELDAVVGEIRGRLASAPPPPPPAAPATAPPLHQPQFPRQKPRRCIPPRMCRPAHDPRTPHPCGRQRLPRRPHKRRRTRRTLAPQLHPRPPTTVAAAVVSSSPNAARRPKPSSTD
jgi:hypothetical protein